MAYGTDIGPGEDAAAAARTTTPNASDEQPWPLWEVFVQPGRGLSHVHVGSLHAVDGKMALHGARDLYTRRGEGESIWVVPSAQITASHPGDRDMMFEPALDKAYRHPTFYTVPDGVTGM